MTAWSGLLFLDRVMKFVIPALSLALLAGAAVAAEAAAPAPPPAAAAAEPAKVLTMESKVGELIDNPKTDAVLKRLIPELRASASFNKDNRNSRFSEAIIGGEGVDHAKLGELEEGLAAAQQPKP